MTDDNDDDIDNSNGILKWIPTIMLVSVITGFLMLSYYAYNTGRQSVKEEDLIVIEAEKTPMKEKPLDPGGMQFPNQDKTIFETFSNNQASAKVERVLPTPEEPITTNEAVEAMAGENNDKPAVTEDDKKTDSENVDSPPVEVEKIEAVGIDDKKSEVVKAVDKKISENKIAEPKTAEKKPIEKPQAKSGSAKIQLGAFGSEKEANENWTKIQKKFPSLSGKTPIIVSADVKGKTFYRLRLGGFSDKESAKEMCKNLSAKGQSCMAVD